MYMDMESQIHQLEQEAYSSVLRAFKAQADAISWEKESLITELRKELRVSDDEHRELLTRVNGDDIIHQIREWRQTGSYQPPMRSSQSIQDVLHSPTVSGSRKKHKASQPVQSLPGLSSVKSVPFHAGVAGGRPLTSRSFTSRSSNPPAEAQVSDPLIGRKVWTRWPEDNHFYEAVITDYNPAEGRHALVYDIKTPSETWEWVDLKEISPEDIRWDEDPGIPHRGGYGGQGHGVKKFPLSRSVDTMGIGRGRGHPMVQPRKEFQALQNGIVKRVLDEFELLNTDLLVQEVERVFAVNHPDPTELEKAKNMLKEHEQALVDAIARLADTSDNESDGERPLLDGQLMETG